ncbi:uncharacterized protein LOC125179363 [Hyalella azteca]|uniref:Uncharacterized protein LOC125179363 n=1 Tax=Hyalella azteca TaxID=294128 RepID=A0A979FUZ3_HYAAZ|nr:uncharacterized protein LOC125179363 [Hyalella azteca]
MTDIASKTQPNESKSRENEKCPVTSIPEGHSREVQDEEDQLVTGRTIDPILGDRCTPLDLSRVAIMEDDFATNEVMTRQEKGFKEFPSKLQHNKTDEKSSTGSNTKKFDEMTSQPDEKLLAGKDAQKFNMFMHENEKIFFSAKDSLKPDKFIQQTDEKSFAGEDLSDRREAKPLEESKLKEIGTRGNYAKSVEGVRLFPGLIITPGQGRESPDILEDSDMNNRIITPAINPCLVDNEGPMITGGDPKTPESQWKSPPSSLRSPSHSYSRSRSASPPNHFPRLNFGGSLSVAGGGNVWWGAPESTMIPHSGGMHPSGGLPTLSSPDLLRTLPDLHSFPGLPAFLARRRRRDARQRRQRTTFTSEQTLRLEMEYHRNEYISRCVSLLCMSQRWSITATSTSCGACLCCA